MDLVDDGWRGEELAGGGDGEAEEAGRDGGGDGVELGGGELAPVAAGDHVDEVRVAPRVAEVERVAPWASVDREMPAGVAVADALPGLPGGAPVGVADLAVALAAGVDAWGGHRRPRRVVRSASTSRCAAWCLAMVEPRRSS